MTEAGRRESPLRAGDRSGRGGALSQDKEKASSSRRKVDRSEVLNTEWGHSQISVRRSQEHLERFKRRSLYPYKHQDPDLAQQERAGAL